ncbi:MAG: GNAT family N-acetyltransferase, partial [Phycicoccus sp.]
MLRPATDDDRDAVLRWRNHPEVRAMSLTQHVISADEHAAWWAAVATDDQVLVTIYERGGIPSGVVTYFDLDRGAGTGWWGYYLDNDGLAERGELLPAW